MDEEKDLFGQETDLDDAIEAFMNSLPDDEGLSEDEDNEAIPENDEAEADEAEVEDEGDEEDDESDEDEEGEADPDEEADEASDDEDDAARIAPDEAEVVVTVDGKEHRVSVKDLKRLYGQEASLTQKSQALAAQRKVVETQQEFTVQLLQKQYEKAKAQADKYKDVDLYRASRELDDEDFQALKNAKEATESEVAALEQMGREFVQRAQQARQQILREQAKEALKVITEKIPEWNDDLYGQIRTYAIGQGLDSDVVNEIVDPAAIVMMRKAMLYDQLKSAESKVTKKVTKAPKKVARKGDSRRVDAKTKQLQSKRRIAAETGDVDDVAELFMAAIQEE